jgi:hypothetical protein
VASTYATELFVKLFGLLPGDRKPEPARATPKTEVLVPNKPAAPGGKVIYHVTPREDDRWNIRKEGGNRPSAVVDNKDSAVERAREIAKNLSWSQVVIHNKDGKIAQEFSYGGPPAGAGSNDWDAPEETDRGMEMTDIPTHRESKESE